MSFETSPLTHIAQDVCAFGMESGNWRWNFEFQVLEGAPVFPTAENGAVTAREKQGFFQILAIHNIDILRPYGSGRKYEQFNAIISVTLGLWVKFLLPNKEFLRVHATRVRLERRGGDIDVEAETQVKVLKPLFRIDASNNTVNTPTAALERRDLDQRGILELDIDLIDPVIEQFKKLLVGGEIWRDNKPHQILQAYFTRHSNEILVDGESVMRGIKMEKADQDKERKHTHLPQGTPLLDVPDILQRDFGIWPAGVSAFLQDRRWYIWPTFNTENDEEQDGGCTIVIVPSKNYQSVERTYIEDGGQLTLLVSSTNPASDIQQLRFLKEGDGVRFTSSSKMVSGNWAEVKDNKATLSRAKNNSEVQLEDDQNQSHYAPVSFERFTDNNLAQMARLASRRGLQMNFQWQNGDPQLLLPGMFFTILTLVDDEIVKLKGRLLDVHGSYQKIGTGPDQADMTSTVSLTVFCNRSKD